ncbi:hypothetical protein M405DRAFT_820067, partial [Rhizopogon salebrosus TDB-379]
TKASFIVRVIHTIERLKPFSALHSSSSTIRTILIDIDVLWIISYLQNKTQIRSLTTSRPP